MLNLFKKMSVLSALMILVACSNLQTQSKPGLEVSAYNPGSASLFPVSSVLVSGPTEIILIDAQFQRNDAQTLVDMINASGKKLTTIYISHGDPDYYFGLDVITSAFPKANVLSSSTTQAYIQKTMQPKLDYWGPILKDNAPQDLIVPEVIEGDSFFVDGQQVKVIGLDGHDPKHTFVWIPSARAAVGGVVVFDNMHAWIADSQTPESRQAWYQTLDEMQQLEPQIVIPGHYLGDSPKDTQSIEFIRQYLTNFEMAASSSADSEELIVKLNKQYPDMGGENILGISAKVIMGEMNWP